MLERWDTTDGKLAEQVLTTSSPEYLRAFAKLAATQGRAVLNREESEAVERAMSLTDANGGYLVPFQLDPTVILTSDGSLNEVRQAAREVVATGDKWHGVSAGAVQWSFDAEGAEVSDDAPTLGQPSIDIHTARGFVPISLEASMDAQNVAQEVGRLLAQGKDDLEAVKFVNGSGTGEPEGVITALEEAGGSVLVGASGEVLAGSDVYKVHDALAARYRSRASWLAANGFYSMVRQLDENGGSALWERIGNGRPAQLIGRNVYEAEAMAGSIAAGATTSLAVIGDFSNFVIADRVGMTVEFIPHLFGTASPTSRPTGQRGWFAYYRVGSGVVNTKAFKVLQVTDVVGP
jgi:HK97 family phage major capsid protein